MLVNHDAKPNIDGCIRHIDELEDELFLPAVSIPATRPSLTLRSTVFAASLTVSTGVFLLASETLKGAGRGEKAMDARGRVLITGRSILSVTKDIVVDGILG